MTAPATEPVPVTSLGRQTLPPVKVAYVMSRFPKLTETFILNEILAIEQLGIQVELYPLLREQPSVIHAAALPLVERAHYLPFLSFPILRSQVHFLVRRPGRYIHALAAIVRGTWGNRNFLLGGLSIFPKVAHAARQMHTDGVTHVHCHFANHPAAAGFIIRRLVDIPFSFTAHGSDLHVHRQMLCQKVAEATFVVPISDYNRQLILQECGETWLHKLVVIHCGVDVEAFRPMDIDGAGRKFTILCVASLEEVKGHRHLIEACGILDGRGLEFVCQLVGDGPKRSTIEAQIRELGLEERVTMLGPRTAPEIVELMRAADVLVAPSVLTARGDREGIPVVLMEAMASGVSVVASRISGIPELISDGEQGLLVSPGEADALADALDRLAGDPALRRRLGRAGRTKVVDEFDVARNAARLAALFPKNTATDAGLDRAVPRSIGGRQDAELSSERFGPP